MKNNILTIGSIAYDYIMNFDGKFKDNIMVDKIHILNVCFITDRLTKEFGGTAGNIAYNLKLLGENPIIYASVGKDYQDYAKWIKHNKINKDGIDISTKHYTATAHIITDQDDNQITAFHKGASSIFNDKELRKIISKGNIKLAIVSPFNKQSMLRAVRILKKNKIPTIFDPGQWAGEFNKSDYQSVIPGLKMIIGNDYEMSMINKVSGLDVREMNKACEYIITTKGAKGSEIYYKGKKIIIKPGKPKNTSDPTGAGDAFRAGVIKGIVNNMSIEEMGQLGSITSLYTVEKYGTQTHRFTKKELKSRYRKNYKESIKI